MKRTVATLLTLAILFSINAFAVVSFTKDDFATIDQQYKNLYQNDYVTAYVSYNNTIDELIQKIKTLDTITLDKLAEISAFVSNLKTKKADFFGNRNTPTKSRYIVPALREEINKAYTEKNFNLAYTKCQELIERIHDRINFLNGMKNDIKAFSDSLDPKYNITFVGFNGEGAVQLASQSASYSFVLVEDANTINGRLLTGQSIKINCMQGQTKIKEFTETVPALPARCATENTYQLTFIASSNLANSANWVFRAACNGADKMVVNISGGRTFTQITNVLSDRTYFIDIPKSSYATKPTITVNYYSGTTLLKSLTK